MNMKGEVVGINAVTMPPLLLEVEGFHAIPISKAE